VNFGPLKLNARNAAAILAAWCAVGCDGDRHVADWWRGEQERLELGQRLKLQQFRCDQANFREFEEFQKLRQSTGQTATLLNSLRHQQLALAGEVESLQGQWAEFRESTLRHQRQRAIGWTFETFTMVSGRTYEKVSVASIDDAGVTIRHTDGSARLRFADLNADQRLFFGLEEDLMLAAADRETENAAAYEHWIDERMASLERDKAEASEISRRDELAAARLRESRANQLLAAANARALAQPAKTVTSRSWSDYDRYSGYGAYRPTFYRYVYYPQSNYGSCNSSSSRQAVVDQMGAAFRKSSSD